MLYSEFINCVGNVCSIEYYHARVEPKYKACPETKDEFCLKYIGSELHRVNDMYVDSQYHLEAALLKRDEDGIVWWTERVKKLDAKWDDLMSRRAALIKRMYA